MVKLNNINHDKYHVVKKYVGHCIIKGD